MGENGGYWQSWSQTLLLHCSNQFPLWPLFVIHVNKILTLGLLTKCGNKQLITLLFEQFEGYYSPDNPCNMAADEGSGYFQTGFWHVVKVVKSRNLVLTQKNMLLTPWLVWSQYGGACSLSSVQGDIALIKLFSVAFTPDFIAGWSQLFPGISSRLSNARSETRYDAQCHSCRFS